VWSFRVTRLSLLAARGAALVLVAASCLAVPLAAQTREMRTLTLEGVKKVIAAAEAEARANNWNVSIAVVDAAGDLVYFQRSDEASPASVDLSRLKARTAARFRRTTRSMDSTITAGRPHTMALEGIAPIEGGIPIEIDGRVIGGIGVSGATSAQDAQVARAGLVVLNK